MRINVKTRWPEYGHTVDKEDAYLAVKANTGGSRPRELFEDLVEEMEEAYDRAKHLMKDAVRAADFRAGPETPYQEFAALVGAPGSRAASVEETFR